VIVINTLDFAYPLPPHLFGGRQILIPADGRPHEVPDYDFRRHPFPGIVVLLPRPQPIQQPSISSVPVEKQISTVEEIKIAKKEDHTNALKGVRIKSKKRQELKRRYEDRFKY